MFNPRTHDLMCAAGLEPLPLVELEAFRTEHARIFLKPEWLDPDGLDPLRSIKRKPACVLTSDIVEKQYVGKGSLVISATSGNLGIELGLLARQMQFPFFAVVPGSTPEYNLEVMRELGIHIIQTTEQETCPREYTVFFVRGYSHEFHHRLVNVEQYSSWLNPLAHAMTTGPEIFAGLEGTVDYVVASLGSCGTTSGIGQYIKASGRATRLVGAQPASRQGVPGTHIIKGDCRWSPENYSPVLMPGDSIETVDAVDSFAFTAKLWDMGIPAGPSTGMALALAHRMVRQGATGNLVITSPDNNFKYGDLLRDKLRELSFEISVRYPELELDEITARYIAHLEAKYSLGWTLEHLRACYPVAERGRLFAVEDIDEIVTGDFAPPQPISSAA